MPLFNILDNKHCRHIDFKKFGALKTQHGNFKMRLKYIMIYSCKTHGFTIRIGRKGPFISLENYIDSLGENIKIELQRFLIQHI